MKTGKFRSSVESLILLCHCLFQVCIIGKGRTYSEAEEAMVEERRYDYIREREALFTSSGVSKNVSQCGHDGPHSDNGQDVLTPASDWVNGFQPREKTEAVRNCSALPRDFVDAVVLRVAEALLSLTEKNLESSSCGDAWNTGGKNMSNVSPVMRHGWLKSLERNFRKPYNKNHVR